MSECKNRGMKQWQTVAHCHLPDSNPNRLDEEQRPLIAVIQHGMQKRAALEKEQGMWVLTEVAPHPPGCSCIQPAVSHRSLLLHQLLGPLLSEPQFSRL